MAQWLEIESGDLVNIDQMQYICIARSIGNNGKDVLRIRIYRDDVTHYVLTENDSLEAAERNLARVKDYIATGRTIIYYAYEKG